MAISRAARAERHARVLENVAFLAQLRAGDAVKVTMDEREYDMTVSRELHRSDGQFGSVESSRVTVTLGPGLYSRSVSAEQMAEGWVKLVAKQ